MVYEERTGVVKNKDLQGILPLVLVVWYSNLSCLAKTMPAYVWVGGGGGQWFYNDISTLSLHTHTPYTLHTHTITHTSSTNTHTHTPCSTAAILVH